MTMVKIKAGVFGHNNNGVYELVPAGKTIEVEDALAHRLVEEKGVAEYVAPVPADELPAGTVEIPEYSLDNTAEELREIGELCGLTFKKNMSKADMIAALDKFLEENVVEGVEITEDGKVAIINGEDAPTFDATEAVQ